MKTIIKLYVLMGVELIYDPI